jgi:hypothetical protein
MPRALLCTLVLRQLSLPANDAASVSAHFGTLQQRSKLQAFFVAQNLRTAA